jgi:hypothetical protein
MGAEKCIQNLVRKPERKDHLEDTGIDERKILTCSFTECGVSVD